MRYHQKLLSKMLSISGVKYTKLTKRSCTQMNENQYKNLETAKEICSSLFDCSGVLDIKGNGNETHLCKKEKDDFPESDSDSVYEKICN